MLQFYAVVNFAVNRTLSLEIASDRAWILICGTRRRLRFLEKTSKEVLVEVVIRGVIPGILVGIAAGAFQIKAYHKMERGESLPANYGAHFV